MTSTAYHFALILQTELNLYRAIRALDLHIGSIYTRLLRVYISSVRTFNVCIFFFTLISISFQNKSHK